MAPGHQATQSAHAAINFTFERPSRAGPWFRDSNYLVLLQAPNENSLIELINKAESKGIAYTIFREPDMNNQITSVALEPGQATQKLVSKHQLLLQCQ